MPSYKVTPNPRGFAIWRLKDEIGLLSARFAILKEAFVTADLIAVSTIAVGLAMF
jgi:hypothetical protein